jgi:hypothetical protein
LQANGTKTDPIGSNETISVASRTFVIFHMGLISDGVVWCWLLVAHWCQAMPSFGLQLDENESFEHKKEIKQKLTPLAAMKPYQLLPDHWLSSIWV